MPVIKCPVPNCQYQTQDVETSLVVALLNLHAPTHTSQSSPTAPVEKVKRPTVKSAGMSEDWTYFISHWTEYKEAINISGREAVIQLLECCEEQLWKDLSRNAGGSLTNKPEDEVLAWYNQFDLTNCFVKRRKYVYFQQLTQDTISWCQFVSPWILQPHNEMPKIFALWYLTLYCSPIAPVCQWYE